MSSLSTPISIMCLGDTMPGGILHYESDVNFCGKELLAELLMADIRVATLETAIGDKPLFDKEKMIRDKDVIYCPTVNLKRLGTLGINVVSLANNHAWDLGVDGMMHAKRELDQLGIKYCGAGLNIEEAEQPAVINIKGKKVAFIAYCDNKPGTCGYIPVASPTSPGINLMDEAKIRNNISRIRPLYDYLFVMMHWGKEYYHYPTPEVNTLARKIIDWGADGVIGSHSHQIQPTIFYKGKPIIFSMGNFFFPDRIIAPPRSTFYPCKKPEISRYPVTNGYPMVDQPTFKTWKPVARKGMAVALTIYDRSIEMRPIHTALDGKSHIGLNTARIPLAFRLSHILVKVPCYSALFFVMRGCRYLKKKIKGEI